YSTILPLNLGAYWQIVGAKGFSHLLYKPYSPKLLVPFANTNNSIFSEIDKKDIMLSLPFESFSPVEKMIVDASRDPNVLSIRITLYRVGTNSKIVKALIDAAESGKMVTAVVELKARFDEENNLFWAKALETAGAHVIYGIRGLKIHAKVAHVIRETNEGLKHYVHLATGNYNPSTAKVYTDISFFTSNKKIAEDATKIFHHITGFSKKTKLSKLQMSPTQIKPKVISLIEAEMEKGKEGEIIAKVNSLVDVDVISALYKAAKVGVKIKLIVRGVCSIRPGVKDLSENIQVISIVGKYLEHSRVFYFKHGDPKVYFSSADWMTRNLDRRIEILTPVFDRKIGKYLEYYLRLQLKDNVQARELRVDGEYYSVEDEEKEFNSQEVMEKLYSQAYKKHSGNDFIIEKMEELL
ncbi:MAG: polyphosphate kinase 1, partial [Campylobacterales bacterium]|nr:polyphosphate kinase 1 [Campylobacterales bacterium]